MTMTNISSSSSSFKLLVGQDNLSNSVITTTMLADCDIDIVITVVWMTQLKRNRHRHRHHDLLWVSIVLSTTMTTTITARTGSSRWCCRSSCRYCSGWSCWRGSSGTWSSFWSSRCTVERAPPPVSSWSTSQWPTSSSSSSVFPPPPPDTPCPSGRSALYGARYDDDL